MSRESKQPSEYPKPVGTIALMVLFFLLILILWGTVYLTLLERGVTR